MVVFNSNITPCVFSQSHRDRMNLSMQWDKATELLPVITAINSYSAYTKRNLADVVLEWLKTKLIISVM